jgi:hypothetical protein
LRSFAEGMGRGDVVLEGEEGGSRKGSDPVGEAWLLLEMRRTGRLAIRRAV